MSGLWCHVQRNADGTVKRSYGTRRTAATAAARLLTTGAADTAGIYECPKGGCGGWHVTSRPRSAHPGPRISTA